MKRLAALTVLIAAAVGQAALADSINGKAHSSGVTFTTATGGAGYAKFNARLMPSQSNSEKTANGTSVVVKIGNTPANLDVAYSGKVACYRQDGNTAVFAGPRDDDSGLYFRIHVQDNEGTGTPDMIRVQDTRTGADCAADADPFRTVETGDIKVHQR